MKPKAFVLMPFDEEFEDIYDYLIHGPLSEVGYEVKRADDILNQRNIMEDIVQSIIGSDLIVADLSTANPNVYYELGLAHAFKKKVILLAQEIKEVPFDLQSYRVIHYSTHFTQMNNARQELQKYIEKVRTGKIQFGSPVTDFGTTGSFLTDTGTQSLVTETDDQDERGILDYRAELEESMETMAEMVGELGKRLENLTLDMESVSDQLKSPKDIGPKKQRVLIRSLAPKIDEVTSWLQQGNIRYRQALESMGNNLNAVLNSESKITEEDKNGLIEFIQMCDNTEEEIQEALDAFENLVSDMDDAPRIEKEFQRTKRRMSAELKIFIDNTGQTQALIVRARKTATRLLDGNS